MERYVIIVAGGRGLRMGGDVPKQFIPIGGKPVLMHTVDVFRKACPGIKVILVLPREHHGLWHDLCSRYSFEPPFATVAGGETRFHSVGNGLEAIPPGEHGTVGVHDGVRPFVSEETIRECYSMAESSGSAIPVVPVVETLRYIDPDGSRTVPRDRYRLVQTPQVFGIDLLRRAYSQPFNPSFTDDASVVEAMGHGLTLVEGNRENVKLTTPSDLLYAEFLTRRLSREE
ncbi:2-C-methyl-D-erythritol 4-phosphate cytidylyltransferase [bacterium]|nr:2-C-methyl-D-erythritol 4-phosphate cytidylyltransferase [bacterium]